MVTMALAETNTLLNSLQHWANMRLAVQPVHMSTLIEMSCGTSVA